MYSRVRPMSGKTQTSLRSSRTRAPQLQPASPLPTDSKLIPIPATTAATNSTAPTQITRRLTQTILTRRIMSTVFLRRVSTMSVPVLTSAIRTTRTASSPSQTKAITVVTRGYGWLQNLHLHLHLHHLHLLRRLQLPSPPTPARLIRAGHVRSSGLLPTRLPAPVLVSPRTVLFPVLWAACRRALLPQPQTIN